MTRSMEPLHVNVPNYPLARWTTSEVVPGVSSASRLRVVVWMAIVTLGLPLVGCKSGIRQGNRPGVGKGSGEGSAARAKPSPCVVNGVYPVDTNYTQEELDRMDCLCRKGDGRCCLTLGLFATNLARFIGQTYETAMAIKREYNRLACEKGSGVGCLVAFWDGQATPSDRERQALARAEEECEAGDAYACYEVVHALTWGYLGPKDEKRARALAERGCRLGEPGSCEQMANYLSVSEKEQKEYQQRACEAGPITLATEQRCMRAAWDHYRFSKGERLTGPGLSDPEGDKNYPEVSFDALVILCSATFSYSVGGKNRICEDVLDLCRKADFKARNKEKRCPELERTEERYQAAMTELARLWPAYKEEMADECSFSEDPMCVALIKERFRITAARDSLHTWPPRMIKIGYLVPSCKRLGVDGDGSRLSGSSGSPGTSRKE